MSFSQKCHINVKTHFLCFYFPFKQDQSDNYLQIGLFFIFLGYYSGFKDLLFDDQISIGSYLLAINIENFELNIIFYYLTS